MPRKRNERLHIARQQQILEAAKSCFITNGFHQTSMRQILDAAEISAGAAYNYFAGKHDIVKAIVEEERADIDQVLEQLNASKEPLSGIAQLVFDCIKYTDHDDAVLAVEIYAECSRNPDIKKLDEENTDAMKKALQHAVSRGVKSGTIAKRYSAEETAEWLLALIDGSISRIATNPKLKPKKVAQMAQHSLIKFLEVDP